VAESNVKLRVDARSAVTSLQQTNRASKKLNETLGTTERKAATATGNIQRMGVSFRTTAASIVAITGAVTFFSRSLNVLGERQADAAALANGLQKLGKGEAELKRLQKAADELGKATLFNQEDFDRGFALLTSFTSIGVNSFERVAEAAADVAQITGQDVNSSLLQLAKALQDPVRGLTALSRSGTTFTDQQKEQIKALVESGKQLEAQDLILREIETQYGNAAKAAGSAGYAGAVDSLGESFRDFQEMLGKAVEPVVIGAFGAFTDLFNVISKIPEPAGRLAIEIGLVSGAVIALTKAVQGFLATKLAAAIGTQIALFQTFGAQIYLAAAAQGVLNLAVAAFPAAIALLALGSLIKRLYETKTAQARLEEAVKSGSVEIIKSAIAIEEETLSVERNKAAKMSLLGINAKLLQSQQRLTELRAALIEAESKKPQKKDEPDPAVITEPPPSGSVDTEVKRLEQIAKSSAERVRSLEQQTLLASALTDEEQKQFERQIQIADIIQNTKGFSEEQLRAELAATIALHEQQDATEAINKANEQRKKNADELAKKQKEQADEAAKQAKKLEDLYKNVGTAIENGIVNGIMSAIDGTKSLQESLASVLRDVGSLFLQFGVRTGLNAISPSVFPMAEGGYVSGPTNALIGEGGEPEYVIPESKMRESMSRYSRGSRGSSVIPEVGGSGASSGGGGLAVAAPIDVRYTVERINSVDYVTADQFQNGMQQAATQGAKQGEQQTLKRLQMSSSARRRIGI